MSLRISSALAVLALTAGCGAATPPPPGDAIDCAIGAGAGFSRGCTLEQVAGTGEIVIHHPGGGFRRLVRDPATGTLAPRDGAEPLTIEAAAEGALAFAIGEDRYRIPSGMLAAPAS